MKEYIEKILKQQREICAVFANGKMSEIENAPTPAIDESKLVGGCSEEMKLLEKIYCSYGHTLPVEVGDELFKIINKPRLTAQQAPVWANHLGKEVVFGFEGREKRGIVSGYHPQYGVVLFVPGNAMIPYHYVREDLIEWLDKSTPAPIICTGCGKSFNNVGALYSHKPDCSKQAPEPVEGKISMGYLRDLIRLYDIEKISLSRFLELINNPIKKDDARVALLDAIKNKKV